MESIIIGEINNSGNRIDIDLKVSDGLKKYFDNTHFFAEYTCDISDVPDSVAVLPVLLNLLPFSWLVDCIVWVTEVDAVFYDAVMRLKNGFRELHPNVKFGGTLIAAKRIDNRYEPQREAMTLFTGGIDATTTFLRIKDKSPILFHTNGWYRDDIKQDDVYDADKAAITQIAERNGVDTCFVRSNFGTFINGSVLSHKNRLNPGIQWWYGFQHSMAFLGCSCVAGFHYKVKTVYIASSNNIGWEDPCASDPRTDCEVKCGSMNVIHDSYDLSRQEKIAFLVEYCNRTKESINLRVCSFNDCNCGRCEKCIRSMLGLIAEGVGDLSAFGFSVEEPFLDRLKDFLKNDILELKSHFLTWFSIIDRMKENYEHLQYKEVYDFLKDFDFKQAKRQYLFHYYTKNFFSILKRKLFRK